MQYIHPQILYTERVIPLMPLDWILKLENTKSVNAYKVAYALWFMKNMKKGDEFQVTINDFQEYFKINDTTLHRSLFILEKFGLISVKRQVGKSPIVTLIYDQIFN